MLAEIPHGYAVDSVGNTGMREASSGGRAAGAAVSGQMPRNAPDQTRTHQRDADNELDSVSHCVARDF